MWGLMHVWDCPSCGQRLDDQIDKTEVIDTANDRTEGVWYCTGCGADVKQRFSTGSEGQQIPVMAEVDEDRMWFFAYGYSDPDQDDEDEDYGDDNLDDDDDY